MTKITNVKVKDYSLICRMADGSVYEYDMGFVHSEKSEMIEPLKEEIFFKRVFIEYGSLAWPNGYDIHASTVVREGRLLKQVAS